MLSTGNSYQQAVWFWLRTLNSPHFPVSSYLAAAFQDFRQRRIKKIYCWRFQIFWKQEEEEQNKRYTVQWLRWNVNGWQRECRTAQLLFCLCLLPRWELCATSQNKQEKNAAQDWKAIRYRILPTLYESSSLEDWMNCILGNQMDWLTCPHILHLWKILEDRWGVTALETSRLCPNLLKGETTDWRAWLIPGKMLELIIKSNRSICIFDNMQWLIETQHFYLDDTKLGETT